MPVILSRRGQAAKRLDRTVIDREDYLQSYIHENPHAIPLEELRDDLRLSVLAREVPTESGAIDAIAVDDEGVVYLIETKLYRNPDKRQVLAQILDYGAALWARAGSGAELLALIERPCQQQTGLSVREKLAADLLLDDQDVDEVLEQARERFEEGTFRFVVLMDRIHDRLKTLLRFVNENSRFAVLGVELDFYQDDDIEILIPRLYGAEVSTGPPQPQRRKWDESSFFAEVEKLHPPEQVTVIRGLYDWAKQASDRIVWGTGRFNGSFNPRFHAAGTRSLFTVRTDGLLSANYGWIRNEEPGDRYVERLTRELWKVEALRPLADSTQDYPSMPVGEWAPVAGEFITAIERAIGHAVKAGS